MPKGCSALPEIIGRGRVDVQRGHLCFEGIQFMWVRRGFVAVLAGVLLGAGAPLVPFVAVAPAGATQASTARVSVASDGTEGKRLDRRAECLSGRPLRRVPVLGVESRGGGHQRRP